MKREAWRVKRDGEYAMKEQSDIRKSLEAVHDAIEKTDLAAHGHRLQLQELLQDIENTLREPDSDHWHLLLARLETAIVQLEAEHPTLSQLIIQAINALNNAGV